MVRFFFRRPLPDLTPLCRAEGWRLATWDCDRGLTFPLEPVAIPGVTETQDPLAIIRALPQFAHGAGATLVAFERLTRFLGAPEIIQALARQIHAGKNSRRFVAVLAPVVQIPAELDKFFTVVDHELPGHAQLEEIARGVATRDGELPEGDDLARVIEAAAGLTASEAENAHSLALVRHGRLEPDAMAPDVVFCDELEKALAGASSSGNTDSDVAARVLGSLLTWLNDHDSDVFFVGTCNDASKLPPEFARAERFDGVFFVDLPGCDQKNAIWGISTRNYGLDAKQACPDDANWTGAEIKSCCRLASLLDVPLVQASQNVVPVAVTTGDKTEVLRQRASGRCLSADRVGVYSRLQAGGARARRVVREPGVN